MVDLSCVLSAILFATSSILSHFIYKDIRHHFDRVKRHTLDPTYLKEEWEFRTDQKAILLAGGFLNALAWFSLAFPIIKLAWILSHGGSTATKKNLLWIHVSIVILVLAASFTEWMSHFFWIGTYLASRTLLKFNLENWVPLSSSSSSTEQSEGGDSLGWKTLEVNHVVNRGFIWIVDAFEWFFLSFLMILIYISVRYWRVHDISCFGGCWNNLGLLIGLMSLTEFALEVLRFEGIRAASRILWMYSITNRLILLPTWILTLGYAMDRAMAKQAYGGGDEDGGNGGGDIVGSELVLTEMSGSNDDNNHHHQQQIHSIDNNNDSGDSPQGMTLDS